VTRLKKKKKLLDQKIMLTNSFMYYIRVGNLFNKIALKSELKLPIAKFIDLTINPKELSFLIRAQNFDDQYFEAEDDEW
jgi:hypothetical protein